MVMRAHWGFRFAIGMLMFGQHLAASSDAFFLDFEDDGEVMKQQIHGAFVKREGKHFVVNGEPYYVNGWNSYWLMTQAVEEHTRARVTSIFKHGAALGMTLCRTWAFNDAAYDALQMEPGAYSVKTFQLMRWVTEGIDPVLNECLQALDFVVAEARRHGVRLLLTLVNNLPEYGGKNRYVQWARDAGDNLDHRHDDHFFTHPRIREYYKAHVKMVLTRVNSITKVEYRNDPTIFGWELINEPRCTDESSSNALLTVGLEGFYKHGSVGSVAANPSHTPRSGTDFIQNHDVAGIDFATVHAVVSERMPWESHSVKQKFFNTWVDAHIKDASEVLHMPVLFAEFGLFDPEHRVETFTAMYDRVYESAKQRGAGAGALAWQLLDEDMERVWNDGFAIFPEQAQAQSLVHLMKRQSCRLKVMLSSTEAYRWCCKSKLPQSIPSRHFEVILAEYQFMQAAP